MTRRVLLAYQWLTGLSDAGTGVLLCVAPEFTLRLMGVHAPPDAIPYVSYIGAFVLSVGLSCLYGGVLLQYRAPAGRLETVWLLTALSRSAVAIYVLKAVFAGALEASWITVASFDAGCVVFQAVGLRKRWLANVE
jgi:hypothetical protein